MITPNKIAFFCLRLFFGIGTFQWVTADSNKIFLPLRLASPKFVFSQVPRRRASEARVRSGHRESCTRTSVFRKGNVAESGFSFSRSAGRGGRRHSPQPSPRGAGRGGARALHSTRHSVGRQRGTGSRAAKGVSARRPPRGLFPALPIDEPQAAKCHA